MIPDNLKPYAKALVGFLTALVGALAVAAVDNSITLEEWLVAIGAGLGTLGFVWRVPNKTS